MNFLRVLTREEAIGGLEITDAFLRLALLTAPKKGKPLIDVPILKEIPLPAGIITDGRVRNKEGLVAALRELVKTAKHPLRYVIASIPPDTVYTHIFSFPRTVTEEKLAEAMKFTMEFQLPFKQENYYIDWELIGSNDHREVLLAAVPRDGADDYMDVFRLSKVNLVAIEFHGASIARAFLNPSPEVALMTYGYGTSAAFSVIKDKMVWFNRTIPSALLTSPAALTAEAEKIRDFYESESGKTPVILSVEEGEVIPGFLPHPEIQKHKGKWLACMGAALRGLIPRSKDTMVSLMPVGTEEAYEHQKAASFSEFLSSITIGLSIFFAAVFLGAWVFMTYLQRNYNREFDVLTAIPVPKDTVALEARAEEFNSLVQQTGAITKEFSRWSVVLGIVQKEIDNKAGITVTGLLLTSPMDPITINGIAKTRQEFKAFRKSLDASTALMEVKLPLPPIEEQTQIKFSGSFKLKDPAAARY